jgi:hypothetical protein
MPPDLIGELAWISRTKYSISGVIEVAPVVRIVWRPGAATIDPALLTAAEKFQYEGYLRREGVTRHLRHPALRHRTRKQRSTRRL